jgi:hypothetical protein
VLEARAMSAAKTRVVVEARAPESPPPRRTVRVATYATRPQLVFIGIGDRDPDRPARATAALDVEQAGRLIDALGDAVAKAREAAATWRSAA